jgi:RND family efflux transporter MFP subunit
MQHLSQSDFDRSRTQAEAARRQYETARNSAEQQYQLLLAARARMVLARKALADTVVKAPFEGVVEQRLVSVGDYVIRGTKVASVMRTNPLRVELTVPEQFISEVSAGRAVTMEVDAYPGETFTGKIRYVSPAEGRYTRAHRGSVVANDAGRLKPGFFRDRTHRRGVREVRDSRAHHCRARRLRLPPRLHRLGRPRRAAHRDDGSGGW